MEIPENNTQITKPPLLLVNQNITQIKVVENSLFILTDKPDHPNFNENKNKEDDIEEVKKKRKKK